MKTRYETVRVVELAYPWKFSHLIKREKASDAHIFSFTHKYMCLPTWWRHLWTIFNYGSNRSGEKLQTTSTLIVACDFLRNGHALTLCRYSTGSMISTTNCTRISMFESLASALTRIGRWMLTKFRRTSNLKWLPISTKKQRKPTESLSTSTHHMGTMVSRKKPASWLLSTSKVLDQQSWPTRDGSTDSRKEKQNFIEYMKVFDDNSADFDPEKVANLILKKWGKKSTGKSGGSKKPHEN